MHIISKNDDMFSIKEYLDYGFSLAILDCVKDLDDSVIYSNGYDIVVDNACFPIYVFCSRDKFQEDTINLLKKLNREFITNINPGCELLLEMNSYVLLKNIESGFVDNVSIVQEDDLDIVANLLKMYYKDSFNLDKSLIETKNEAKILIENNKMFKLVVDDNIVSLVSIFAENDKYRVFNRIITDSKYRGKGYGKMIVSGVVCKTKLENKLPVIYANKDYVPSNRLYQSVGLDQKEVIRKYMYN